MSRLRTLPSLVGIMLLAPFLLSSCDTSTSSDESEIVNIVLANHEPSQTAPAPVDILDPLDAWPCSTCQVLPGGGYRVTHLVMSPRETFLFKVYRNGVELTAGRVVCVWKGEQGIMVDWNGTKLLCVNWEEASVF